MIEQQIQKYQDKIDQARENILTWEVLLFGLREVLAEGESLPKKESKNS